MRRQISQNMIVSAGAAWIGAVTAGFVALCIYKTRPAGQDAVAASWPKDSRVRPAAGRDTLLLFAHPQCACTRATIAELANLMARFHDRLEAKVLFTAPAGSPADFTQTDLWSSAARIPGA